MVKEIMKYCLYSQVNLSTGHHLFKEKYGKMKRILSKVTKFKFTAKKLHVILIG